MKKPLTISLITVCFNSEKTIEETIQSVMMQDYPHIQYIIVDGASKDNTLSILSRYRPKIHTLITEPDKGIYDAMNKGIDAACGDVVGLLNADDLYASPQVISQVAAAFGKEDIEAVYGDLIYFKEKAKDKVYRYWRSNVFKKGSFAKGWSPAHPTFFVRRSLYEQYGKFDTHYRMGNDIELMMRFLEKHHVRSQYIPCTFVKMRLGGASNRALKNIMIQNLSIIEAAKKLQLPISLWTFVFYKVVNRLAQFIFKSGASHDTQ